MDPVTLTLAKLYLDNQKNQADGVATLDSRAVVIVPFGGTGRDSIEEGHILFGQGASDIGSNSAFVWDNVNQRLGINESFPDATLEVLSSGNSSDVVLRIADYSNDTLFTIRNDGAFAFPGGTVEAAQTGYTEPDNLSTLRTFDANDVTIDELADVLGTLIQDLKAKGIISQ
jgi:hypothetical protein